MRTPLSPHTHTGLTMFRHLPRHMFGYIQSKLFPKYFLLGTILSSLTILSYLVEHPFSSWSYKENIQVCLTLLVTME